MSRQIFPACHRQTDASSHCGRRWKQQALVSICGATRASVPVVLREQLRSAVRGNDRLASNHSTSGGRKGWGRTRKKRGGGRRRREVGGWGRGDLVGCVEALSLKFASCLLASSSIGPSSRTEQKYREPDVEFRERLRMEWSTYSRINITR